jgi:hypothetical protein
MIDKVLSKNSFSERGRLADSWVGGNGVLDLIKVSDFLTVYVIVAFSKEFFCRDKIHAQTIQNHSIRKMLLHFQTKKNTDEKKWKSFLSSFVVNSFCF